MMGCNCMETNKALTEARATIVEQAEEIKGRDAKIGDLQRLCERAFLILSETWDEHTDDDGYGPLSLLRDLESVKDGREYKELKKFADMLIKACNEKDRLLEKNTQAVKLEAAEKMREACADFSYQAYQHGANPLQVEQGIRNINAEEVVK